MLLVNAAVESITIVINGLYGLVLINSHQTNLWSCYLIVRHNFFI